MVLRTEVEGPGLRSAVWVQGCSIKCPGCFNPHTWDPSRGTPLSVDVLVDTLTEEDVEGITLLGGEPFDQARPLGQVARAVQAMGRSVMVFTGYTLERLRASRGASELLSHTDLLVDGPYRADLPDRERPWVGSTNQRFHFFTDRYRDLETTLTDVPDRLEVSVKADGHISVIGWAPDDVIDALLAGLRDP